mgnify:CR=1 FL=1
MKKIYAILAVAAAAVCTAFAVSSYSSRDPFFESNVEALMQTTSTICWSGGVGAQACSIDAGTEILGVGVSAGCSVSCYEGYYACCSIRCQCMLPRVPVIV